MIGAYGMSWLNPVEKFVFAVVKGIVDGLTHLLSCFSGGLSGASKHA
jgi:hypothetical protein